MEIAPLSLVQKGVFSPHRVLNHHDSLIFSITSEKMNSRKQTLLLDESKQMKKSTEQHTLKDYFKIQDKIKLLEEKVENIQTQYCESDRKQDMTSQRLGQPDIINLEFPEQIYDNKCMFVNQQSQIGKIKRKKSKYYTGVQQKTRQKSKSSAKNQESIVSTKRNNLTTYNIHDFSVYKGRNSLSRQNETIRDVKQHLRERSLSHSLNKKQNSISGNNVSEIKKLRQQLCKNKLSTQKLSRKSKQSQRKLSICKEEASQLKNQNSALHKEINFMRQKLKKSEIIKQRQKQTIHKQKAEIDELKNFLEEVLKRSNDVTLRQSFVNQKEAKVTKLRMLR